MKVRFQSDADFNADIVTAVVRREPSVDFQTADAAGLRGLDDLQVLTHDRKTMPMHFAEFIGKQSCPGVLVVSKKTAVLSAAEDLLLIWAASEAEEWRNLICTVPL